MAYIAKKPCSFAGVPFKIDDSIPAELIQPGAVKSLITMGVITEEARDTKKAGGNITVYIHAEEGDVPVEIPGEEISKVFDVLQAPAEDAKVLISTIENHDVLLVIHICDSRKTVKAAAEARAKELGEAGEA